MYSELINRLREAVSDNTYWRDRLETYATRRPQSESIHLGIFSEPYLSYVLDGTKSIESRFSLRDCPPFGCVSENDIVLLKAVGGPIIGLCCVTSVWYYHLARETLSEVRKRFGPALCVQDPQFWDDRAASSFATLMQLNNVQRVSPLDIDKRDRRGWVVLNRRSRQLHLWAE